jgi:hypothetical protein
MSFSGFVAVVALAILEGVLVALPRAGALEHLGRLRSPAWAAFLPGLIVVGTFGVLAVPSLAVALVVLAGVATPLLAVVAVLGVVRGRRVAPLLAGVALAVAAGFMSGWASKLSESMLTALGCLTLGAALVRLIPRRWIFAGVLAMCAVDVALLASGLGQTASDLVATATAHVHGPVFDQAEIGPISTDYPDLLLAAVLGGAVAGQAEQSRAAVLVAVLAAAYGMLLPFANDALPATVPVAVTFLLLGIGRRLRRPGAPAGARAPRFRPRALRVGGRSAAPPAALLPASPAWGAVPATRSACSCGSTPP